MSNGSYSGMTAQHRKVARQILVQGARLMLSNIAAVHYSQDADRWEGITLRKMIFRGQYPTHSDCSSAITWMMWNALHHHFNLRDVVNGTNWASGYTGTMLAHGKPVTDLSPSNLEVGDCAIYDGSAYDEYSPTGHHVVMYVGGGMWFSHGGEDGPFKVALNYRNDLMAVRRYI